MTITLSLENLASSDLAPLYSRYDREVTPQPAYVEIDELGRVTAGSDGAIGREMPLSVYDGRTLRVAVPATIRGEALAERLQEPSTMALLERVHAGHSVDWDDRSLVGSLNDDAEDALDDLSRVLGIDAWSGSDLVAVYEPGDWLISGQLPACWPSEMTLREAAAAVDASAEAEGAMIDGDTAAALLGIAERWYEQGGALSATQVQALLDDERLRVEEFWQPVDGGGDRDGECHETLHDAVRAAARSDGWAADWARDDDGTMRLWSSKRHIGNNAWSRTWRDNSVCWTIAGSDLADDDAAIEACAAELLRASPTLHYRHDIRIERHGHDAWYEDRVLTVDGVAVDVPAVD